ncbi:MAG: LytTR family transcriptional regulator [Flavobacteriaceae bacterium]|nr:LytTR family transcriptional regulator [Flavobacteriaceae bacterium]
MKINLLFYKVEDKITNEIKNFSSSFSNCHLTMQTADSLKELHEIYNEGKCDILFLNISSNVDLILNFLCENNLILTKVIIYSNNKNHVFDFVKCDIFDFIEDQVATSILLTCINKCVNKIMAENNLFQLRIAEAKFQKFIPINSTKKIELIKLEDIIYLEADGRYTVIYLTNGVSKMASKNLGEFQKLLDPDIFCRIHHKFIINMNNLLNIVKSDGFYCEMTNNKNVPVSKRKLDDLSSALNIGKHLN